MTTEETNRFIDCMTYEDGTVMLKGRLFWCLGVTYDENQKLYRIQIYEDDPQTKEYIGEIFKYESHSCDDCMKHFLEDKYWDGLSFYEVAHEIEWIDL